MMGDEDYHMNYWKRTLIGAAVCIGVGFLVSVIWFSFKMPWNSVAAGVVNSNGVFTIPDKTGTLGTNTNPFVILEIVPNENMAQFGYLVGGQEPIDLSAAYQSPDREVVKSAISSYMTTVPANDTVIKQEFVANISVADSTAYYWDYYVNANQYGYYERLSTKTGNYDLTTTTRTVTDPNTLITKTIYKYKVNVVTAGTGWYKWVGYGYVESSALSDTTQYQNSVESETVLNGSSQQLRKIYGYQENVAVHNAYEITKVNNELFKKYALGLAYKDNDASKGEDSTAYNFVGWYQEPEGVNPYNQSDAISGDVTLYAKWKTIYSSGSDSFYTITFHANAGSDEVLKLPSSITYLNKDDSIIKPKNIPLRKGYLFAGWYLDAAGNNPYDFSKKITENATLYAKWTALSDKTYTISYNANGGAGAQGTVVNMPAAVADVRQNGRTTNFDEIKPVPPTREGYIFAGWYWNSACTNPFAFDQPIPTEVTTEAINLYAKWIASASNITYKVTFNVNKPSSALSTVTEVPDAITGLHPGDNLQTKLPETVPVLEGNISNKLASYQVKVITVTPADFTSQTANMELINRANLIVMNETCETQFKNFWSKYRNSELFSKVANQYNSTKTKFTENDLSWDATLKLINKVTGLVESTTMCPVIYDYSIYQSVINSTSNSIKTTIGFTSKFSGSVNVSINNVNGYSSNVYKLFLITQQFNPVTLYNAYIKESKIDSSGNFTASSSTGISNNNYKKFWNNFTLLPYEVISSSNWNSGTMTFSNNALEVIGINSTYTLSSGAGRIRNRVFVYNSISNNIAKGFITTQLPSSAHKDMNEYFYPGSSNYPTQYTTAEGIYYMLHNTEAYKNFDKTLRILEIEPSDSFKSSEFWFWYISRYVPNLKNKPIVFTKNSSEFIGDIADLNSQYDAIYLGVDATNLITSLMPSSYRYAHVGAKVTSSSTRRGSFHTQNDTIDQYLFSGNDITKVKMNHLLAFAQAGYPIILSGDIFSSNGSINTSIIDKSSYIYNLLLSLTSDSTFTFSCFSEKDTSRDDDFVKALNNKSFHLEVKEKPVDYVDRTDPTYQGYTEDKVYINGAVDGGNSKIDEKNLEFTVKINTTNTGYYEVRLYIDTNADGKFDKDEENLDSLEIENTSTNKGTKSKRLVGGQSYRIVRQIEDYTGSIPWKLEIIDVNRPLVRDEATGLCAIKVAEKTKLNVLQIISDGINEDWTMPTVYFPTNAEITLAKSKNGGKDITEVAASVIPTYFNNCIKKVNSNTNLTVSSNSSIIANAGWFYYYTKILKEFDVEFYRLSVTEFSTLASNGVIAGDTTVYLRNGKCTYLTAKGINMLILGYADCYSDITNTRALQLIDDFISAGSTTLFTHDTTSFVNLRSKPAGFSDTYWGYNINQYFREILGMDRFNVMENRGVIGSLSTASDKPYMVNTLQSQNSFYTATGTNVGSRVLTQGMSNVTVGGDGSRVTAATKVNNGQIVTYPYLIPDNLTVASTHAQYYQLDMEADDTVVWYCLDGTGNYYKTDNDVRNTYYIYNKGNITYSGVGHSGGLSDNERRLFVNTMIASYRAGTVPSKPIIINKDKSNKDESTDYLYVDYDATVDVGSAEPFGSEISSYQSNANKIFTKRVYFTPKNFSIILNKKLTVHYYPVIMTDTASGTQVKVLTEYPIHLKTFEYDSDTGQGTEVTNQTFQYEQTYSNGSLATVNMVGGLVQSNYDYYVDVPISDYFYSNLVSGTADALEHYALDSKSWFGIQIQIVMRYGTDEAVNTPLVGSCNVAFMKRGMFMLD
ncbi:MAG: hypothetical protein K0S04_1671 [Herbinix sp.]|nr:hypothetical protein [Herbinix sp.]